MATEYSYYGSQDLSDDELLHAIAAAIPSSVVVNTPFIRRNGLTVTPYVETSGEEADTEKFFGFTHRITVTFRFENLATREVEESNIVIMVTTVLHLLQRFAGAGVLLFNHEYVVLACLTKSVVMDSEWEELDDVPQLRTLVADIQIQRLPQPFLEPSVGEPHDEVR